MNKLYLPIELIELINPYLHLIKKEKILFINDYYNNHIIDIFGGINNMLKYPILRFKSHYITLEILFQRYKGDWANGSRYHKYICGGGYFIANNKLDNYTIIPCVFTHSLLTSCISNFSITGSGPPCLWWAYSL